MRKALKRIIDISIQKIYRARIVVEIEAAGHEVLPGLMEQFMQAALALDSKSISRKHSNLQHLFPTEVMHGLQLSKTKYQSARLVVDFVSGLTDRHAISLYRKIKGFEV